MGSFWKAMHTRGISEYDLENLKKEASKLGFPYSTLLQDRYNATWFIASSQEKKIGNLNQNPGTRSRIFS